LGSIDDLLLENDLALHNRRASLVCRRCYESLQEVQDVWMPDGLPADQDAGVLQADLVEAEKIAIVGDQQPSALPGGIKLPAVVTPRNARVRRGRDVEAMPTEQLGELLRHALVEMNPRGIQRILSRRQKTNRARVVHVEHLLPTRITTPPAPIIPTIDFLARHSKTRYARIRMPYRIAAEFESRSHKQTDWVEPEPA
jgi:hypothetical protein